MSRANADALASIGSNTIFCAHQLLTLADQISKIRKIESDMSFITQTKGEILLLAKELASVEKEYSCTKSSLRNFQVENSFVGPTAIDTAEVSKKIKKDIVEAIASTNILNPVFYEIENAINSADNNNEDIEEVVAELTEASFKCPVTACKMDIPLKK